jgi:hypothetical protein
MSRTTDVQVPGETANPDDTKHSVDAALEAAATGRTHRVKKHREAPPTPTVDDPMRPAGVGVNARAEIPYDEAMAMLAAGTLTRSVLTPQGWVCPAEAPHPSHRTPPKRG